MENNGHRREEIKMSKFKTGHDNDFSPGRHRMGYDLDSDDSIIKLDDEKSEYKKSQTFRQAKDLGNIHLEFKQKIAELKKSVVDQTESNHYEPRPNAYTHLPSVGDN
jgi:hypothetical protein